MVALEKTRERGEASRARTGGGEDAIEKHINAHTYAADRHTHTRTHT